MDKKPKKVERGTMSRKLRDAKKRKRKASAVSQKRNRRG